VLIVALFIMLVLGIVAVGFMAQAEQTGRTALAVSGQQIAVMRAEAAAMDAVRAIRGNQINPGGLTARPPPDGAANCANVNCIMRVQPPGPATVPLREGGGLQWEWVVYKSMQPGTTANRYTIQANGFYGYTNTAPNFTTARVEVEIDIGDAFGSNATEYGGNSGAL
jgi:Tfp pilus assembly protein PilX